MPRRNMRPIRRRWINAATEEFGMFKLMMIAGLLSLLAACSTGGTSGTNTMGASGTTANTNPPRSPGEGPSINPYYGGSSTR